MRRAAPSFGTFLLLVAACAAAAPAMAQPQRASRVVVQRFAGPRGNVLRRAVIRDLEENGVVVVDESEVRDARRRLGFGRSLEDHQYVELARELNAAAYVDGRVRRRRRRWALTVRVRNAADGAELGTETWAGRTAASLNGVRRTAFARIGDFLGQARSPAAVVQEPEHAPGEEPWYARRDVETPPVEEEEEEEPAAPTDESTRYDAFVLAVGGGTLFRSMETPVSVYESHRGRAPADPASAFITENRRYQSGGIGHFELGGRLELYPGAFEEQAFPYLGLVFSFSHSVGVQSNGFDRATGEPVAVPTDQLDLYVGARGRYRLGPARSAPELRIDAGWGMFNFDLGADALQRLELDAIIPPMQHGYLHLSAGIRFGVVPRYFSLGLDVGYRIGTNVGAGTRNVWGTETGPSNGFVMGAEVKIEVPEAPGLFFALYLQFFQFTTDFAGQVGCVSPDGCPYQDPWQDDRLWEVWPVRPPTPGTNAALDDVVGGPTGSVHDNYFRMQLQVGYAFR